MTKSEVKAIIHEVMEQNIRYSADNVICQDEEVLEHNRLIYQINKSLCQAIDEAEDEAEWEYVKCGVRSYAIRCPICGITLHKGENFESLDAFQKFINDMCKERNLTFDKYCHNCGKKMKAR